MAPLQVVVLPLTNTWDSYGEEVLTALKKAGVRAEMDGRNEKVGYKIRELSGQKIPLLCVVGEKEAQARSVSIRRLGSTNQHVLSLEALVAALEQENHPLSQATVGVD
jgi:threonyl-tRNA synthetase